MPLRHTASKVDFISLDNPLQFSREAGIKRADCLFLVNRLETEGDTSFKGAGKKHILRLDFG